MPEMSAQIQGTLANGRPTTVMIERLPDASDLRVRVTTTHGHGPLVMVLVCNDDNQYGPRNIGPALPHQVTWNQSDFTDACRMLFPEVTDK